MRIQAQQLVAGDKLKATGEVVEYVQLAGINIPSGKMRVDIVGKNTRYWNKRTEVVIEHQATDD